jgi:hypothetical protein
MPTKPENFFYLRRMNYRVTEKIKFTGALYFSLVHFANIVKSGSKAEDDSLEVDHTALHPRRLSSSEFPP